MEQVAYAFESRMGGTNFSSTNPADYGGTTASNPQFTFTNPATGSTASVVPGSTTSEGNVIGNEDQLVIFLGARSRGANHLLAGPNGYGTGFYYPGDAWVASLGPKNTSTNWEPMMGASSVNTDATFYFDTDLTTHADATSSGKVDFYSVMVHEIGHIMGFTSSNAFANFSTGNTLWTGPNAKAEYNNQNIPLNGNPHWATSLTQANVNCACHPSMQPSISSNVRTSFSDLDFALLKDVGYSISATPVGTNIGGTYTDPTWEELTIFLLA